MTKDRILASIATLGPIGHLPAPGTMGSLVAVVTGVGIAMNGGLGMLAIATLMVSIIGLTSASAHFRVTGIKDSGAVVIDEVAGQWLVLLAIPFTPDLSSIYLIFVVAAFLLFRFFDIVKFGPVKMAEDLPGAAGVMADDVVAGALAGGVVIMIVAGLGFVL